MPPSDRAILFLTSWYPVSSDPYHGIFIRNHALALSRYEKVIVVYACSRSSGPYYEVEETNVNENLKECRVFYPKPKLKLPGLTVGTQLLRFRKAYQLLLQHLLQKKVSVKAIQVNIVFPASIVLNMFRKVFPVPHTIAENWSGYLESDGNYKGAVMKYFTRRCFAGASKIWHVSELMKEAMKRHGLTGSFELLYNTVNTEVFRPGVQPEKSRVKLLHVSSLVEREKNTEGTLRVMKKLQDKGHDMQLTIVGGDEEAIVRVKKNAEALGLKNIFFKGKLPPEKIAEQMQQSSALILFSHFEGMPVVALEALSCGLPVLATKVGQLPWLIREEFGRLAETDNEKEMLEITENFIKGNYHFDSKGMRDFILSNASFEAVGKQLADAYKNL